MSFSFIHVSDIHLGRPFSNLADYSDDLKVKELYKKAVEKTFNNFVNFALAKNVDFVLISGDTFDSDEHDFESKLILKEGLKKLENADIKVFLICGNHDPLSSYNKLTFNFDENSIVKIVGLNSDYFDKFIVKDKFENPVAIVRALSFKDSIFAQNPANYFEQPTQEEKALFNIGLLHCDLEGDKQSPYAPCTKGDLDSKNYDYWALGHIHIPNMNDDTIAYSGTIQGRNTKETGCHGIKYIKVDNGMITKNVFVPVDVIRFEDIDFDLSEAEDATIAAALINDNIENFVNAEINSNCELFFVRLNLIGNVPFYNELNDNFFDIIAEKIKQDSFGKVCISEIRNNTTARVEEKLLLEDEGVAGTIYSALLETERVEKASDITFGQLKHLLTNCNFTQEELNDFSQEVKVKAKETCINLCSQIYNNDSKEDVK